VYFILKGEYRGLTHLAELGWTCVVRKRMVNGLDHRLGPTLRSGDGKDRPVVQQGFDLFWNDAPLQSVKGRDMLPLVPGRSCERCRKCAPKALVTCEG
jgi:hypothetical protein